MKSRWLIAVAVLVPLVAVGCSTSKEKPGSAKAAYITQVDVVCKDVFAKSASIGNAQDQATAQKQAEVWRDAYSRIRAYPIPGESVELARQFLTDMDNLDMSYTAAANAYATGFPDKAARAFSDAKKTKEDAAKTAKEYGYKECTAING